MRSASSLRARFIATIVTVISMAVVVISSYFVYKQAADLDEALTSKTAVMREELQQKGMAEVRNLGLAAERAVTVMDFAFLSEVINTTMEHDAEIIYGAVLDKNGRALVHSDPLKVGTVLVPESQRSDTTWQKLGAHELTGGDNPVLEVQAPIRMGEKPWGAIRLGLSERKLQQEIVQSTKRAKQQVTASITTTVVVAIGLLLLASVIGSLLANRLVQPLSVLMRGVNAIRDGNLSEAVEVSGAREFKQLAAAFNGMSDAVKQRDDALRHKNRDLEYAVARAEEASRLKSEFLANISHELRTPLNAIVNAPHAVIAEFDTHPVYECSQCGGVFQRSDDDSSSTESKSKSEGERDVSDACPTCNVSMKLVHKSFFVGDADKVVHFANRQLQAGAHLLTLVNDLLDFSKLEAGKTQLHREDVQLADVVDEARTTIVTLAEDKKLKLIVNAPRVTLCADPVKLKQICTNLLGNAIKFTPAGGTVTLKAEDGPQTIHFRIIDTGIGIPKDKFEIIFESFRQADGSHTRAHQGTGLGLTISRQLVELHGGNMWVESEVGVGSTFHFTIPKARNIIAKRVVTVAPGVQTFSGKVLVIDDDTVQLELARMILERDGLQVLLLPDPSQTVPLVQAERPGCIVLDIMMPHLSGLVLLRQLKEHPTTAHVPVLVSTGYHSNREVVERLGGIWVPKPWADDVLVNAVRQNAVSWN